MLKFFTRILFCLAFLALGCLSVKAQSKVTLSGYVKDTANAESLLAASVYIVELSRGANTNEFGFYSLTVPPGKYTIKISYVGYATKVFVIDLNKDTRLNTDLQSSTVEKEEVV